MDKIVFIVYSVTYGTAATGKEPEISGIFHTYDEADYLYQQLWHRYQGHGYTGLYCWIEKKNLTF